MIIVTAAVMRKEGKILIARRAAHKSMGGKWEFPGGKVEQEESPEEALVRELKEELNIEVQVGQLIAQNDFMVEEQTYRLQAYQTTYLNGDFSLTDHDQIKWVSPNNLPYYDFSPADIAIVEQLIINN